MAKPSTVWLDLLFQNNDQRIQLLGVVCTTPDNVGLSEVPSFILT